MLGGWDGAGRVARISLGAGRWAEEGIEGRRGCAGGREAANIMCANRQPPALLELQFKREGMEWFW